MNIPSIRIKKINSAPVRKDGAYVLYWMIAYRRIKWNFSLDRAIWWAKELKKPLLILEALRCDYPWASDRFHQFIFQGMADNAKALKSSNVRYYPYVEPEPNAGKGLLVSLAKQACVVVTDDFPGFFLLHMIHAASRKLPILLEKVDSNGMFPMRKVDRVFPTAYAFRRFLQKKIPDHLFEHPCPDPFKNLEIPKYKELPAGITKRWPPMLLNQLKTAHLSSLPLDHNVPTVEIMGGPSAAEKQLTRFMESRLRDYAEARNHPDMDGTSGFSPYFHFGHLSVHQVFHSLISKEDWFFDQLASHGRGSKTGWWRMSLSAEAFLDQMVTWRELGFNMCFQEPDYDHYKTLPDWARTTLAIHQSDPREYVYSMEDFENCKTHDALWNAAQNELFEKGKMHNYLRMLWGKKILEWTQTPEQALKIMIHLNNKYALDGRDPNSTSGIFWILGRYDRAWGPERPVFGKIRYMSSKNTMRKLRLREYLERYSSSPSLR